MRNYQTGFYFVFIKRVSQSLYFLSLSLSLLFFLYLCHSFFSLSVTLSLTHSLIPSHTLSRTLSFSQTHSLFFSFSPSVSLSSIIPRNWNKALIRAARRRHGFLLDSFMPQARGRTSSMPRRRRRSYTSEIPDGLVRLLLVAVFVLMLLLMVLLLLLFLLLLLLYFAALRPVFVLLVRRGFRESVVRSALAELRLFGGSSQRVRGQWAGVTVRAGRGLGEHTRLEVGGPRARAGAWGGNTWEQRGEVRMSIAL